MRFSRTTMTVLAIAGGLLMVGAHGGIADDCNNNGIPDECELGDLAEQVAKLTASDAVGGE